MRNTSLFAELRLTPVDLLDFAVQYYSDESPFEIADRVLAWLPSHQIKRIALETLITLDPATDLRAIAKDELIDAIAADDWETREALK